MKDFVLIHGGSHGAWCWTKLIDELKLLGHNAYAFNLPGHGDDSTPRETVTKDSYLTTAHDFINQLAPQNLVIVGHSLAGILLPDLAQKHQAKLKEIVYLAALVLEKGQRAIDLVPEDRRSGYYKMSKESEHNTIMFDFDKASALFFSDLAEAKAQLLYKQLCLNLLKFSWFQLKFLPHQFQRKLDILFVRMIEF